MAPLGVGDAVVGNAVLTELADQRGDFDGVPDVAHWEPLGVAVEDQEGQAVGTVVGHAGLDDRAGVEFLHEGDGVGGFSAVVAGLEHIDVADFFCDAVLESVGGLPVGFGAHEVGGQESGVPVGGDLRPPAHEVRVGGTTRLVVLVRIEGDHLDVGPAERNVRVVAVEALNEGRTVAVDRPVCGGHEVIVNVLVVP